MIGNVFENGAGTCLAFGRKGTPQIRYFTDQGHIFVEGTTNGNVYPNYLKYEGGRVVPDTARVQAYEAREQAKDDRRTAAKTAFVEYRDFDASQITDPEARQIFNFTRTRMLTMLRYLASVLEE